ncbi:MAG: SRPBCC domain-containing protein [Gemmatimonadaceae bacterium]
MHSLTITRAMPLPASTLYRAWTTGWAAWIAEADSLRVTPEVGAPYYFEVAEPQREGKAAQRHPHYGRFLQLTTERLVSLTWVTGATGTGGAETVLTVRLDESGDGTFVTLTHEHFATEEARDRHATSWPEVLAQQEAQLGGLSGAAPGERDARAGADRNVSDAVRTTEPADLLRNRSMPDAALIPVRSYPDVDAAVAWMREVLGGRERLRVEGKEVQLTVGTGAVVAVAWDPGVAPPTGGRPPAILLVRVADVDRAFARALALGATGLTAPANQANGERQASVRDPAGHAWSLTQTVADVDPATWGAQLAE